MLSTEMNRMVRNFMIIDVLFASVDNLLNEMLDVDKSLSYRLGNSEIRSYTDAQTLKDLFKLST